MNTNIEDKRRFERIFHDARTHLINSDGSAVQCSLLDISLNGCLVSGSDDSTSRQVNERLNVNVILGEAVSIDASAHIVFIGDDNKIGFQFDEIDIDSITSLRRLVELNMGDSSLLERNLQSLSTQNE